MVAAPAAAIAAVSFGACTHPADPQPGSEGVEFCDHHPETSDLRPLGSSLATQARVHIGVVELSDGSCTGERIDVVAAESADTEVFTADAVAASHVEVQAASETGARFLTIELEDGRQPTMNLAVAPAREAGWLAENERITSLHADDELRSIRMLPDSALRIDYERDASGWGDISLEVVGAADTVVDIDEYWLQVALAAGGEPESFELRGDGAVDLEIQVVDAEIDQLKLYPALGAGGAVEHSDRSFDEDAVRIGVKADTPVAFHVLPVDAEGHYLAGVREDGPTATVVDGEAHLDEQATGDIVIEGPDGWATVEIAWLGATAEFDFRFFDELPGE